MLGNEDKGLALRATRGLSRAGKLYSAADIKENSQ